jgi:hypothetical protein
MNETTQNCIFGLEMKDVLDFKNYIAELPPIRDCNDVSPEIERRLKAYWYWLGESLDAFFLDKPDPLVRQGLSEVFREFIQRHSNRYLMWTIGIYQAERFLRDEAKSQGIEYLFNKRSDLLKILALEECLSILFFCSQELWVSLSEAQRIERVSTGRRYIRGEISQTQLEARIKRWDKDAFGRIMPWTSFCFMVFGKYNKKIPCFEAWADAIGFTPKKSRLKKFAIVNGQLKEYQGRGAKKP